MQIIAASFSQLVGNLTFSGDFIISVWRLIFKWNECDFVCVWFSGISLGALVCRDCRWVRGCECNSWTICESEWCVAWKKFWFCVGNRANQGLFEFSPSGVPSLEVGTNSDAAGFTEIALYLKSCIACRHQLWVVLDYDNVWKEFAFLNRLTLPEGEFHRKGSCTTALHVAWCFVLIEATSRVDHAGEVFFGLQLDLHWVGTALELHFLKAFSRRIDVEWVWEILLPHICRWFTREFIIRMPKLKGRIATRWHYPKCKPREIPSRLLTLSIDAFSSSSYLVLACERKLPISPSFSLSTKTTIAKDEW